MEGEKTEHAMFLLFKEKITVNGKEKKFIVNAFEMMDEKTNFARFVVKDEEVNISFPLREKYKFITYYEREMHRRSIDKSFGIYFFTFPDKYTLVFALDIYQCLQEKDSKRENYNRKTKEDKLKWIDKRLKAKNVKKLCDDCSDGIHVLGQYRRFLCDVPNGVGYHTELIDENPLKLCLYKNPVAATLSIDKAKKVGYLTATSDGTISHNIAEKLANETVVKAASWYAYDHDWKELTIDGVKVPINLDTLDKSSKRTIAGFLNSASSASSAQGEESAP